MTALVAAGVDPAQLILDPGLGFAKLPEHNWTLLASLDQIARQPGYPEPFPVLVAASRKGFLGKLLAGPDGRPGRSPRSDDATIALTALAVAAGAWCVRVHAVPGNVDAVRVATRWRQESMAGGALMLDRISIARAAGPRTARRLRARAGRRARSSSSTPCCGSIPAPAAAADDLTLTADYGALAGPAGRDRRRASR